MMLRLGTIRRLVKKRTVILFIISAPCITSAQPLTASNSTIYRGAAEFLYYKSEVTDVLPRYNYDILNTERKPLLHAVARKYEAPLEELQPFYYYTIIFNDSEDSLAVYFNGGLFIDTLSAIIDQYKLVDHDKIDTAAKRKFLETYSLAPIMSKLASMQEFLDRERWFSDQVERDRTKPITIKNDKDIYQDGKKIGYLLEGKEYEGAGVSYYRDRYDPGTITPHSGERVWIFVPNGKKVAVRYAPQTVKYLETLADERFHEQIMIKELPKSAGKKRKSDSRYQALVVYLVENYYL
jgi:hypothetical protein